METSNLKHSANQALAVYVEKFTESSLQVYDLTNLEKLCVLYQQEIVNGNTNPKIKDTSLEGLTSFIASLISMVQVRTGFKNIFGTNESDIEKAQLNFIEALLEDFRISFGNLRQLEIREAVRRGANRQYQDEKNIFIVATSTFCEWIRKYLVERSIAVINQKKLEETQQTNNALLLPQGNDSRERCLSIMQHIIVCHTQKKYVHFGQLNLLAGTSYDFVTNNNLIVLSGEQKKSLMDEAMLQQVTELMNNRLIFQINKAAKEFLKDWSDTDSSIPPRNRVDKNNEFYKLAILKAKKIAFANMVFEFTQEQWLDKFNSFLIENHYQKLSYSDGKII